MHLHRQGTQFGHRSFIDLPSILRGGDLLVLNDTVVSARRLFGARATGAAVEALLLRQIGDEFEALTRPAKKLKIGESIEFEAGLIGVVTASLGEGLKRIRFEPSDDLESHILSASQVPLPPYIHTPIGDQARYQTVYGSIPGSSAAPTAGLHFTDEVFKALAERGVQTATVTLDIGLDTFRPVSSENIEDHLIHGETCSVAPATCEAVAACKGRIIGVGTTSTRTLESLAIGPRRLEPGSKDTRIFITPGYEFKVIDGLLTNFHMPRTTMLFMVAALVGRDRLMDAYREAVEERYRFLSFGDSMLVL